MSNNPPMDVSDDSQQRPPSREQAKATEHLWRTLQSINEWTRFADAKAGAILTADGVLGTLAASIVKEHWTDLSKHGFFRPLALVGGFFLMASAMVCVKCLYPKTRVTGETRSLLYFHHIAIDDLNKYLESTEALCDDEKANREVAKQVWANAKVAREKHREVAWAIGLTGASLACACSSGSSSS